MFQSVLIANRGEIAVRIVRTCKRLGLRAIAVYSDADRLAQHVAVADEAVRIGPAAARDSYLNLPAIIDAARRTGAEAIHPGYGFLSEKSELAKACATAGVAFVGPSPAAIAAMGQKIGAKRVAAGAGVPSVPGYLGDDQSTDRLVAEALKIGLPVMIKASAGGGGKGMRRGMTKDELKPAIELARREAQAAFGDPMLLIEKLVLRPRHLEAQVAGDKHGNAIHLFERDCSIQRNNQKLIEEAPAPRLSGDVREKLLTGSVALARAVGYDNLGTVEFILEEGQDEPWFLEMNTRLQVEHPVTELVTGLDLVELQLRLASGEALPFRQSDIRARGHAIEARVTTERADRGFQPDIGPILAYREPLGVRVDSGVAAGSEVTQFYDSMVAKVVACGPDREAARIRLAASLRNFTLLGLATTLQFTADCLDHPLFVEGRATTRFIEEAFPGGWSPARGDRRLARAVAAVLGSGRAPSGDPGDAWKTLTGFRLLAPASVPAEAHLVVGSPGEGTVNISIAAMSNDRELRVSDDEGDLEVVVRLDGEDLQVVHAGAIRRGVVCRADRRVYLQLADKSYVFDVLSSTEAEAALYASGGGSSALRSPMPGVISAVKVSVGDLVAEGDELVVLESMKLFMTLPAGVSGAVAEIACRAGEVVQNGQLLLVIDPSEAGA